MKVQHILALALALMLPSLVPGHAWAAKGGAANERLLTISRDAGIGSSQDGDEGPSGFDVDTDDAGSTGSDEPSEFDLPAEEPAPDQQVTPAAPEPKVESPSSPAPAQSRPQDKPGDFFH
jgi:hypothetical protein